MGTERQARARVGAPLLLGLGLVGLAAGTAPGRPAPAPPPVAFDVVDQALLERPGAALRHAVEAFDAGEAERAEALLVAIARRHPIIADYADLERLRDLVLTGRAEDALALASGWPHGDSPLRAEVHRLAGRTYAERGEEAQARASWRLALALGHDPDRQAELLLAIAASHLRTGEPEEAAEALLDLWARHPLAPEAEPAGQQIAELEERLGRRLRDADLERRRADRLFRARRNESALEGYERALALGTLAPPDAERARRQRAHTLFRLRRYPEAAKAFSELSGDASDRIQYARSVARAGDARRGAEELERIANEARGSRGRRARLLAALLWESEKEVERARNLFRSLAEGSTRTSAAQAAVWRLGWEAYRAGRLDEADREFERLAEIDPDPIGALRARYWRGRVAERRGDVAGAAERFGAIAREYPLSYYGWRASARAAHGPSEAPARSLARGRSVLAPRELERPRILLEAGFVEDARHELDRLLGRARGLDDRLALADLYADAGDFHRPQRLMVDAYQETLARGPVAAPVELWWHAWPLPYGEAVSGAASRHEGLDPALVYAVMREESGYRPEVLSVSGARGLLQLMPETAERVARRVALPRFSADDLFVPDVNIRLGAAYLDELLRRFSGRASAAIGSYNAGPHRVARWLDGAPADDDDEWVEAIPFEQTRAYVKRVLRSMHAYRVLY